MRRLAFISLLLLPPALAVAADTLHVDFDTVIVADHDANIYGTAAGKPLNYGIRDSITCGSADVAQAYIGLHHYDFSWLPQSADSPVTITLAIDSMYAIAYAGATDTLSQYQIVHDWFEGTKRGANADSFGCCWNWAGFSTSIDCLSVCGNHVLLAANMQWPTPQNGQSGLGTTAYGAVSTGSVPGWYAWTVTDLVQILVNAGKAQAYGIATAAPTLDAGKWLRFRSRENATYYPRLRVAGYYTTDAPPFPAGWITASDLSCDSVLITWENVEDEDSFQVRRNGARLGVTAADVATYTDKTGMVGTRYLYEVASYRGIAASDPSASDSGGIRTIPAQVTGLSTTASRSDSIVLTWDAPVNADTLFVLRDGSALDTLDGDAVRYADAPPVGRYSYEIAAVNACGPADISAAATGSRLAADDEFHPYYNSAPYGQSPYNRPPYR